MPNLSLESVRRIEDLVSRVAALPDRESRETAQALMESILELHGAGLERMMEVVFDSGESGKAMIRRFAGDSLVSSLLVLHGLHPDEIETRVEHALSKMRADAELVGVFEGVVRVRLTGSGCGLREAVDATLREAIPDATNIIIEESVAPDGFVPLTSVGLAASTVR